jgi:apolipoprotein D and lipocalin family protein
LRGHSAKQPQRQGSWRRRNQQLLAPSLVVLLAAVPGIRGALAQGAEGQFRRVGSPPIPLATTTHPPASAAVTPVAQVDLQRYSGAWYEIARIPNRFQRQCSRHTIAQYSLRSDGAIKVLNQCIRSNGSVDQVTGLARVVEPSSQAKLKVSLVSFLGWRPFWGDYWVIGLDPHYRWAVVGSPDRRYGWLLARTPQLAPAELAAAREMVERNGYTWSRFQLGDTRR